jgi:hypothetical protein
MPDWYGILNHCYEHCDCIDVDEAAFMQQDGYIERCFIQKLGD